MARTLGIRLEDKNAWERRVPLTPAAVRRLAAEPDLDVQVQRSPTRVFPDESYAAAGAELVDDPFGADVVVAVKEIPTHLFRAGGTYVFFSHTIKGQPYNMDMLRRLMALGCNLVDYERVVDERGRRLIFFSWFAGAAGAIDTLHAAGQRYASLGIRTPFEDVGMAHTYGDLVKAEAALKAVGERILTEGLSAGNGPFVLGITGYGNVSQGSQHVLSWLPVEYITPEQLRALRARVDAPRDRLYVVVFSEEHMVEPRAAGAPFVLGEYFGHPERYRSIFVRHVPHLDVMINAIYWTEASPRLLTNEQIAAFHAQGGGMRLQVVGDISCDLHGSVECLVKSTHPDAPCFVYDPLTGQATDGVAGRGLVMMAVDNLPCEIPAESSQAFSDVLEPFMAALTRADFSQPLDEVVLPDPLREALILHRGELTPHYRYMAKFVS
ncbi:MAG: bifunctional lysine ketoglutarate reductase /saccharopine dehydrogenase family protein [Pseudomonadota bacterium]